MCKVLPAPPAAVSAILGSCCTRRAAGDNDEDVLPAEAILQASCDNPMPCKAFFAEDGSTVGLASIGGVNGLACGRTDGYWALRKNWLAS